MIFKIENLGIIEKAEVDLNKDLILLCGHNNTGKSYLAYGIYHWLTLNKKQALTNSVILNKIAAKIETTQVINLVDIFHACLSPHKKDVFNHLLKQYQQSLGDFFASPHQFSATKAYLEISDKEIENRILDTLPTNQEGAKEIFLKLINSIFNFRAYIAPAERSAINIFSKELSLTKNKLFDLLLKSNGNTNEMLDLLRSRVSRYPKPIRDNLEIAEDLAHLSQRESEFGYLAEALEQGILKGKIEISPEGEVKFIPNNAPTQSLALYLTSSLAKSLANLVFYLRYLAHRGDYIIIDEPELNLHPDNQILMARFLGRLVNAGFKVIASTHSDYIIMEMNTLIMLTKPDGKTADLIKEYGYAENQLLKHEQVGAYLFKENSQRSEIIEVSETGLDIETIDEVVKVLNESSRDIYFTLFD
ncbi:MAG: AAA family ATPase [Pseudomonadota bacterium]